MAKEKEYGCCSKCMGIKMLILGVLIILNSYYMWFNWAVFIGGVIAIKGLIGLIMPSSKHAK